MPVDRRGEALDCWMKMKGSDPPRGVVGSRFWWVPEPLGGLVGPGGWAVGAGWLEDCRYLGFLEGWMDWQLVEPAKSG